MNDNMSQPSTADNTMTSEEHDQEVEEYIWSLMGRSGLLSEMKSQIAQFVQNNGKTKEKFSVDVSRIHPAILSMIYEYLQWVGMKNTCASLLCESPVQFDTTIVLDAPNGTSPPVPELCSYLSEKLLAQADKSRLAETLGKSEQKSLDGSSFSKSFNASGGTAVPQVLNQTFLVSSSPAANQGSVVQDVPAKKNPPPSQIPTPLGNNQSHNLAAPPTNKNQASNTASQPEVNNVSASNHVNNNTTLIHSNCSDSSESESMNKSGVKDNIYTMQYVKAVNDNVKKAQKSEKELKPSSSDQSLQEKTNKEQVNYIAMTEKQKMEALNKKYKGSEFFAKKNSPQEELLKSSVADNGAKLKEPEKITQITNPWKKPNSVEPDIEDESISDLNDSTAEDVTQDLSMDSDSKIIAANIAECEHLMNLK